ncbi:uncharacterized protein LOC141696419 [Apium graveolens]|uniref:uncharacterized protein LOC141696419 n=1 Tax=Apium graveolens TaxID=4045 RepID=UPI003D793F0A
MVNETADVPKIVETGSGGTTTIDWTTYCFSQPIDLSGLQFAMSLVENAPDWLRAKLESAGTDELILIAKVLWSIWFFRNKKVCEGKQVDSRDAMGWGTRFFVDWRLVKAQTLQISTTARSCHTQSVTKWSPPSVGAYKLNTDATNVVGAAGFSIGLVIRDHVRIFVAGMVKAIRSRCSVLEAEIVAIREGLRWLEDFTFSRVEVESDSLLFVQAINSPQVNLLEIGFIIDECRDILECRTGWSLSFAKRHANKAAHLMARLPCLLDCQSVSGLLRILCGRH